MPTLDPTTRVILEMCYGALLPAVGATAAHPQLHRVLRSTVFELAKVLGRACPLPTAHDRREARRVSTPS